MQDRNALLLPLRVPHPQAEARQVRGHGGDGVRGAFLRRVAPRLVPRGENAQIAGRQHFLVRHVQEAVVAVQQSGIKNDLHMVFRPVVQTEPLAGVQDGVLRLVVYVVAADPVRPLIGDFGRIAAHGIGIDPAVPAHDGAQGEHVGLGLAQRLVHARQRVEEHVHALVVVFIPPGNDEDPGIRRKLAPQEASRRAKEFGPRPGRNIPFGAVVGDDPHVEAVGRHHVRGAPQKNRGLVRRDAAHRGKAIGFPRRRRFHRAFGGDVVGPGFHFGVDLVHLLVDVEPGPRHRPAEHGRVRRKDRAELGRALLQVQEAPAAHPFVEMRKHRAGRGHGKRLARRLDHLAARGTEHDGLHIIPPAGNGIDAVTVPQGKQKLPLIEPIPIADKDDLGPPRNIPAPEAAGQIPPRRDRAQLLPAGFVRFLEFRVVAQIRAQQIIVVSEKSGGLQSLAAHDGVNAAHFVADFPTDFKERGAGHIILHTVLLPRRQGWLPGFPGKPKRPQALSRTALFVPGSRGDAASSVSLKSASTFI